MAKHLLCTAALVLAAASAHSQTVTLSACNPGTTDVDVYFQQGSNVVSRHVAPAECAELAHTKGAMSPGLIAVGFAGAEGQWGGVHRYERLPPNFSSDFVERTTQTLSVTHGATKVAIPAQFSFKPPSPGCITRTYQTSPGFYETVTRCDDFKWEVNVRAFPETREIVFQRFCQSCDDKVEAQKTPEQRAAEKQADDLAREVRNRMGPAPSTGDLVAPLGRDAQLYVEAHSAEQEEKDRYLESMERDPKNWDRIGWSDVPLYADEVASRTPNPAMVGSVAIVQGTLSGMQRSIASDPWFDVFFQESPDHRFILCTQQPDVLSDVFGSSYATAMVGKKVEVEGRVIQCFGAPGILLKLAHQIKLVGTGAGMVASVTPPTFKFLENPEHPGQIRSAVPTPLTPEQVSAATAQAVSLVAYTMQTRAQSRLNNACANEANQRFVESQAAKRPVDVIKAKQVNAACLTRARVGAEQEGQKAEACARELLARDPRMQTEALYAGVTSCMEAAGSSAQTAISSAPAQSPAQAPAAAPAPVQVPVAAPAPPAGAPAATQQAAAPATAAPTRAQKSRACIDEIMKKLGPNALSDPAAVQKAAQACMQR